FSASVEDIVKVTGIKQELASPSGAAMVGFQQKGSVLSRAIQEKAWEWISVKDFGAVGDGVTDDTGAFEAAMMAVPASGAELYLPLGSYLITRTLDVDKRITFLGSAPANITAGISPCEIVKASSVSGPALRINYPGVAVKSLALRGLGGNSGDGIEVLNGRFTIEDSAIYLMGRDGLRIGADQGPSNCNAWNIRNLRSKRNGRHGLHISDKHIDSPLLPDASGGTLTMADLQGNGECGLYLGNNAANTFVGLLVQENGTYGVFSS